MKAHETERGMALLAVVTVLIALVLIATPFALQMQSAARRSAAMLYTEQADQEAQNVFSLANLYLLNGVEELEREAAARGDASFSSPHWDTPDEFQIPASVLAEFNVNSARDRIWDVRVEDEQAKINVNSAPYALLANLFGATVLARDLEADDTTVRVADPSMFPADGGLVRIGTELIRYEAVEGDRLTGVERGVHADQPWNSTEQAWKQGDLVMNAIAFEVASYPVRVREGRFTPFANPYQIKRISELGQVAMDPDLFDRMADILTCFSGCEVAGGWCNAQTLRSGLPSTSSEAEGDWFQVDNPFYFGRGTLVRITDGKNVDYGIVVENDGRKVTLGNRVRNTYEIDEARVETLARHPINVNTASEEVLVACLENVALRLRGGTDSVTREEAKELVARMRAEPIKSRYQFRELLRAAQSDGVISQLDTTAIYMNSLNPQDFRLGFSTVPFVFKSYDVYTVKATAVVNSHTGEEIARKSMRRVVAVSPRRSTVAELSTQVDFEEQIIASRDAKWFMSFPFNTGGHYEGRNVPPSRYVPHVYRNIWPSTSSQSGVGDLRLLPERLDLAGVYHYDDSYYAGGYYIKDGALSYSTRDRNVNLADDEGMRPAAFSFWYHPYWGGLGSTEYLADTAERTWTNRVGIFYDSPNQELVLRVCDATLEARASEVRMPVEGGAFLDETWYRVGAQVVGSKPGDLTLLLDGYSVGTATHMSRLMQSVPATGQVSELVLEDADSFPSRGAVIIRGEDGAEVFEYDGRSSGALSVTRRFARLRGATTGSESYEGMAHYEGAVVELLGYAAPLVTDLPGGGATLATDLAQFHALKVVFGEDAIYIPGDSGGGGGGGGGGGLPAVPGSEPPPATTIQDPGVDPGGGGTTEPGGEIRGIAAERDTVVLQPGSGYDGWDGSAEDAIEAFGDRGFALLVSPGPDTELIPGEVIGGWEIVSYERSGTTITLYRYESTKQIEAAEPHFVPQHSYGNPDAVVSVDLGGGEGWTGVPTALIPISIEATGADADYFDVVDDDELQDPDVNVTAAYAQIGTEWFAYTYPDFENFGGSVVFVFDRPGDIQSVISLFGGGALSVTGIAGGGGDVPADPGGDDGGGTPPDEDPGGTDPGNPPEPPPGEDDGVPGGGGWEPPTGDEPLPPTEPLPGGEDDGPPSGGGGPEPPSGDEPPPPTEPLPGGEDDGPPSGGGQDPGEGPTEPELPGEDDGVPGSGDDDDTGPEPPPGDDDDGGTLPEPPDYEPPDDGGGSGGGSLSAAGTPGTEVPFDEQEIAARLKHRPKGTDENAYTLADTLAEDHAAGDEILPAFIVANHRSEYTGYYDRVTVATAGGPHEELIIAHNYLRSTVQNWVTATSWASRRYEHAENQLTAILEGTVSTRTVPRLLKFPSGELPDALGDQIYFGGRYDGGGSSPAMIDELYFKRNVLEEIYYLGDGEVLDDNDADRPNLGETDQVVRIHEWPTSSNEDGLPVSGLPEDGGVIRIDDELIAYTELDTSTGELTGVQRGVLGTEPGIHGFGAKVSLVDGITMAVLEGGVNSTAFNVPLNKVTDFPRTGGYVQIDDEILGYTAAEGNTLVMPRDTMTEEDTGGWAVPTEGEGADTGAGIFRGRFGTIASEHMDGAIVYFLPARFPDRYRTRSTHPDTSAVVLRKGVDGAIWKRVSWDERLADFTDVKVLVRFDGTPSWDSDNIYNVSEGRVESGREEDWVADPKSFLYRIENTRAENRLDIQADFVEVRVAFQYQAGAYDPWADPPANSWKDTPWLKALRFEYVAPVTVHYGEDVR